jgi:hypothetical protein
MSLLPLNVTVAKLLPETGSEWCELAIHMGATRPERWTPFRADRWDGSGFTVRSLSEAFQRHATAVRVAANLTPEQREALWADPSPEAAELRRVMR